MGRATSSYTFVPRRSIVSALCGGMPLALFGQQAVAAHPLLEADLEQVCDGHDCESMTAAEIFRNLNVFEASEYTGTGTPNMPIHSSGARWRQVEALPGHRPSTEPPLPTVEVDPIIDTWRNDSAHRNDLVTIVVSFRRLSWDTSVSTSYQAALAVIDGTATSDEDMQDVAEATIASRRAAGEEAMASFATWVANHGGTVIDKLGEAGTMKLTIKKGQLTGLINRPGLNTVEKYTAPSDDAGFAYLVDGTEIDGYELMDLIQSEQFYEYGWYRGSELIALVESNGNNVRRSHPGFEDDMLADRFANCDGDYTCFSNPSPDPGASHATATASILLGDITMQQDLGYYDCWGLTGPRECAERSGVARDAGGLGITNSSTGYAAYTITHKDVELVSQSSSSANDDNCKGKKSWCKDWNSMFEEGVALFNSIGNEGHGDPDDCTAKNPATAIGVFAVGAYKLDGSDNEIIYSGQSLGGTEYEGRDRSITALAAPTNHTYVYTNQSGLAYNYGATWGSSPPSPLGQTSGAAPVAAGAAAIFRDFYNNTYSRFIYDPSVLYVNMLLMGDRYNGSGYQTAQFNNLWGAGKLRLRRFDMMDAPARWETGNVCVDDGTAVTIDLSDKEIPHKTGGVDFVKVVAWWYDHRHDSGTDHDKIDMELFGDYVGGAGAPATWTSSNDNKLMIHHSLTGYSSDWKWHVRLEGRDVTSDAEGCGTNSALVYYALIWEDQDRNEDAWFNAHIRPM